MNPTLVCLAILFCVGMVCGSPANEETETTTATPYPEYTTQREHAGNSGGSATAKQHTQATTIPVEYTVNATQPTQPPKTTIPFAPSESSRPTTVAATSTATKQPCSYSCHDLHPACDKVYLDEDYKGEKNCSQDVWQNRCPRTCHMCTACDVGGQIASLQASVHKLEEPKTCDPDTLQNGCAPCFTFERSVHYLGNPMHTFSGPPGQSRLTRVRNIDGAAEQSIGVTRFGQNEVVYGDSSLAVGQCDVDISRENPIVKVKGVMGPWDDSKPAPAIFRLQYSLQNGTIACPFPAGTSHNVEWTGPMDHCFLHGFYGHGFPNSGYIRGIGTIWACSKQSCN